VLFKPISVTTAGLLFLTVAVATLVIGKKPSPTEASGPSGKLSPINPCVGSTTLSLFTIPIRLRCDSSVLTHLRSILWCSVESGSKRSRLLLITFQIVPAIANCSPTCIASSAASCKASTVLFRSDTLSLDSLAA